MLRESAWVALIGGAVGLGAGLAIVPIAGSVFYGLGRLEPIVIVGAAIAMTSIVLITTYAVVRPWTRRPAIDLLRR